MSRTRATSGDQVALPLDAPSAAAIQPAWTPASDTDASLEAAAYLAKTGRASTLRRQVLASIAASPATDQQLEHRLSVAGNSIRPRRKELLDRGLVEHSGDFRPSPSGRRAKVYRATAAGVQALKEATHG